MNFKEYVKLMLEADKAKDEDKYDEDDEDEDEDEDDEDEDEDDDDEDEKNKKESSLKTRIKKGSCTGCEATVKTRKHVPSDDDEDLANYSCKTKNLKEEIIYSSNYINNK